MAESARAIGRMTGLKLALTALRSVIADASWQNPTLLQWMGQTPTPWPIDGEIGDLAGDWIGERPLLHYLRYDLRLERDAQVQPIVNKMLSEMTAPNLRDMASRLLDLGRLAAEEQVKAEHFPERFAAAEAARE